MTIPVNFQKLHHKAKVPTRATDGSAGYDLYAIQDYDLDPIVPPQEAWVIPTGLAIEIPRGYVGLVCPRSSLGKQLVTIPNAPGVIDSDYRGEVKVLMLAKKRYQIQAGSRIAQLLVVKAEELAFVEVPQIGVTGRGDGGFGSTGA